MGLVSLFSFVAEFGFRDAAVSFIAGATTPSEAQAVARSFLMAKLVFGTLAAALLAGLAGWIVSGWYHGALQPRVVRPAPLTLPARGPLHYLPNLLHSRQA